MPPDPPPRPLFPELFAAKAAGAPPWEALDPQRRKLAAELLARLIARSAGRPRRKEDPCDD